MMVAKKSKRTTYNSQSYKKELKLAFGVDVIVDHMEIHPPSFCKPGKLKRERVLNASSQRKLVLSEVWSRPTSGHALQVVTPYKWSRPTSGKHKCEVSEELISI